MKPELTPLPLNIVLNPVDLVAEITLAVYVTDVARRLRFELTSKGAALDPRDVVDMLEAAVAQLRRRHGLD